MSLETNSDFIFIVVAVMVKSTEAEFVTFQKRKTSKKRESGAPKEAEATFKVEAISAVPISEVAKAPDILSKLPGGVEIVGEPIEVLDMTEAPTGERSPSWAAEASPPVTEVLAPEAINGDKL